jgi:hypothetical protein
MGGRRRKEAVARIIVVVDVREEVVLEVVMPVVIAVEVEVEVRSSSSS